MNDKPILKTEAQLQNAVGPTDWLDGLPWLRHALRAGGRLSIGRKTWNLNATLIWPLADSEPFEADGTSLREVLVELDSILQEDAADEMIEQGAV